MTAQASPFKHLASRTAGRRAPNLAGAIYGTIVAIAVVAGLGESASVSTARAFWILVASGVFFWAAQSYAYLLADRIHGHVPTSPQTFSDRFPGMAALPVDFSARPAVGSRLVWPDRRRHRSRPAMIVGVATLAAWGISFSRREGYSLSGIIAAAAINAGVGLMIVALKVAVP